MKRLLLFIVVGLILVAIGTNWYYTRQIRDQLDRMANAVSMFGTLSYDNVRLSPGGDININDLSFRLNQGRGGIDIGQISLQTANLLALLTLEGTIERRRIPEMLGLRVDNIQFPLDGALATMSRQMPGSTSPTGASGVLFAAAGCDGRAQFSADDLMQMDYFDIRADVEARYRLIDNGDRLRLFASARTYDASAIHLEVTFDLLSGTVSTRDLARSIDNARLDSFSLEYEDLGFYKRMLAFCADKMSMTQSDYIAHHVEAWNQAWSNFNAEPSQELMAAYGSFVENPQQLSVSSGAENSVSLERIEHYPISDLLERMEVSLVVNYGDPHPLEIKGLEASPAGIASTGQPAGANGASTHPDSEDTATTNSSDANASEITATEPRSRWIKVDPQKIEGRRGHRLRVLMHSGDRHSGRLSRVDPDNIHIRIERVGGFYIRPLARGDIRELKVYDRP